MCCDGLVDCSGCESLAWQARGLLMVRCPAQIAVARARLGCARRPAAVMVLAWGGLPD